MKYKTIESTTKLYFVSSVITDHKIIFTNAEIASIPLQSLNWFRENNEMKLHAFCLMPNHLHCVIKLLNKNPIANLLKRFHSFTGKEIVKHLKQKKEHNVLAFFHQAAIQKNPIEII